MCAAGSVSFLMLLTACGGGSDDTKKSSLSPAFVKEANSLCEEWTKALDDLGNPPPLGDIAGTERWTTQLVAIDTGFTDRFKALPATESDKAAVRPIHAQFDAINVAEAATLEAAQKGDRTAMQSNREAGIDKLEKLNVRLEAMGLTVCAE